MIRITTKGDFKNTEAYLNKLKDTNRVTGILNKYGERGVELLRIATPVDSGQTASSWGYEIVSNGDEHSIQFTNSNVNRGVNIAIILQYGHGTRNGGYVQGRDYINPAIRQAFDEMRDELVREVQRI